MESPWLQEQFIEEAGKSLEGFRKVRDGLYNCRCPICGDSATDPTKRRGYFIQRPESGWSFYCHNCGASQGVKWFLKTTDDELYRRYCLAAFKTQKDLSFETKRPEIKAMSFEEQKILGSTLLVRCSNLPKDHDALKYLEGRKVDREMASRIFWTDDFRTLVQNGTQGKYEIAKLPEKGIVFPVRNFDLKLVGWQVRDIFSEDKRRRFATCTLNGSSGELCFVPRPLDKTKPVFVVEGCIDALFIRNSVARLQAALWKFQPEGLECIYFNDQEPRNREVAKEIHRCVDKGLRTVLLPSAFEEMDVNDLVCRLGMTGEQIEETFTEHSWKGLEAQVRYASWRRR